MAALQASIERSGTGRNGANGAGDREALERMSKDELYERAKELGIGGRSKMDKLELAKAIARKQD